VAESLSEEEMSEDEEDSEGLFSAFDFNFLAGAGFSFIGELDPESESELEEELELPFRFKLFAAPLVGLFEDEVAGSFAPVGSFSSSASLSELELDVEGDGDFRLDAFVTFAVGSGTVAASFISASESLPLLLPLSPPLLVSFFARTSAAASSRALASALMCFLAFLDFLFALAAELSSRSLPLLLLVSSITVLSWCTFSHSLNTLTKSGNPFGSGTSSCVFHSSNFLRDCN